jgi:hypothetical protein
MPGRLPTNSKGGRPWTSPCRAAECEIAFKAQSVGDSHVGSFKLLVEGRVVRTHSISEPSAQKTHTVSWKLNLPAGTNRVQVIADGVLGSFGRSDEVVITRVDRAEARPKLFLLGVGVSAYETIDRKGVEYAASDVERLVAAQVKHGKTVYEQIDPTLQLNGKATKAEVLDAFEELSKKAFKAERAVTLIFLAGHGKVDPRGNFYFLAVNSDAGKLRATAISAAELKDALKAIPGKVVVFLDTCHSGALAGDDARNTGLADDLVRDLTSDNYGVAVVCSSRGKELSRQNNDHEAGLFSLALEEALAGKATKDRSGEILAVTKYKNGAIYLPELFAYVNRRVRTLSEDTQHPYAEGLKKVGELPLTKP